MSTDSEFYSLVGSLVKKENDLRRSGLRLGAMQARERRGDTEWMDEASLIQREVVTASPRFLSYFGGRIGTAIAAL